jgi:hypothetical protein
MFAMLAALLAAAAAAGVELPPGLVCHMCRSMHPVSRAVELALL